MEYENIIVTPAYRKHIALLQLNRPQKLNALNRALMGEVRDALKQLDEDEAVRVIILTGNERAFAAGADIDEMSGNGTVEMLKIDQFSTWEQIKRTRKPIIAAVSGFALGGGCELMMTCDMVIASETSQFGQPEIKIGVMPGAGGTQRLTHAVGKVTAMEMVLTGKFIGAEEAYRRGLINRVVPVELYLDEAVKLASQIALLSPLAVRLAKESVNQSFSSHLEDGLLHERKNFYMLFSSADQKEGMSAFMEKRSPNFSGK